MKVMIENYDFKKKTLSQFHRELLSLSLGEIIEFIREIPPLETNVKLRTKEKIIYFLKGTDFFRRLRKDPIKIITQKYIITKKDQTSIILTRNHQLFATSEIIIKIEELEFYLEYGNKKYEKYKKYIYNLIFALEVILGFLLYSTLSIFNIFIISSNFSFIIQDTTIFTIFSILFTFSLTVIIYDIKKIVSLIDSPKKIHLKYSVPYLDAISERDISQLIANFGQGLYLLIFDYFGLFTIESMDDIIYGNDTSILSLLLAFVLIIVILDLFFLPIIFLYRTLVESWRKKRILEILSTKIHNEDKLERNYFLNLYIQTKNKKVIKIGILSKITILISILGIIYPLLLLT